MHKHTLDTMEALRSSLRKANDILGKTPLKLVMNLLTILDALLIVCAVCLGFWLESISFEFVVIAVYLLVCASLLIITSIPVPVIRKKITVWFLFLSTYNGRGVFLILTGLLCVVMSYFGIIMLVLSILLGLVHIILWLFFRRLVTDTVGEVSFSHVEKHEASEAPAKQMSDYTAAAPMYEVPYGSKAASSEPPEQQSYAAAKPYENEELDSDEYEDFEAATGYDNL